MAPSLLGKFAWGLFPPLVIKRPPEWGGGPQKRNPPARLAPAIRPASIGRKASNPPAFPAASCLNIVRGLALGPNRGSDHIPFPRFFRIALMVEHAELDYP